MGGQGSDRPEKGSGDRRDRGGQGGYDNNQYRTSKESVKKFNPYTQSNGKRYASYTAVVEKAEVKGRKGIRLGGRHYMIEWSLKIVRSKDDGTAAEPLNENEQRREASGKYKGKHRLYRGHEGKEEKHCFARQQKRNLIAEK